MNADRDVSMYSLAELKAMRIRWFGRSSINPPIPLHEIEQEIKSREGIPVTKEDLVRVHDTMTRYQCSEGFMAPVAGKWTFFNTKPSIEDAIFITYAEINRAVTKQ
jgi:hypothetical protein